MSINYLKDKKIAILGLGREGLSTSKFLKNHKIKCDVLDSKFDKNYSDKIKNYDVVFRTPGFPRLHPKLIAVEKKGLKVLSQIKLFFDLCPGKTIGVTGTKGKTTTAFLIYEILKKRFGGKVFLAGNFGKPALDILPRLNKKSVVVLELSSFQLQDLHKSPHVAVITNITIDHMDPSGKFGPATHQNAKEYFEAKINIIRYQSAKDFAVINPSLKNRIKKTGRGEKIYPNPLFLETKLKGRHNLENIALAAAVGKIFKISDKKIIDAVKKFKGVEHRLEFVSRINDISFYNDSAATNPDATLAALKSFNEPIRPVRGREGSRRASTSNGVHLILGGSDKGLNYKKLAKYISKSKNIRSVMLIGQLKNKIYYLLKKYNKRKKIFIKRVKTLKEAVLVSYEAARARNVSSLRMGLTLYNKSAKNDIILLSPGAASFDMFENYVQRGEEFKKIVNQLRRR